jgi:hypothetical protein
MNQAGDSSPCLGNDKKGRALAHPQYRLISLLHL